MYARVAMWEGGDAEAMRRSAQQIDEQAGSGPPEGVPSTGLMILIDPDGGRAMAVALFETEEDYRTGDETLSRMDPPGDGLGRRTSVQRYEVAVDLRAS